MRSVLAAVVAVLALALGTLSARAAVGPVAARSWQSAISGYFRSGAVSDHVSCAVAVVARTHLPPRYKEGTAVVAAFDAYESTACARHDDPFTAENVVGMTDTEVADSFGAPYPPLSGPRCWSYRVPPPQAGLWGVRFCFANGRVARAQMSLTTGHVPAP